MMNLIPNLPSKSPTHAPSEADPLHPPGCPQCCPFVLKTSGGTCLGPENVFRKWVMLGSEAKPGTILSVLKCEHELLDQSHAPGEEIWKIISINLVTHPSPRQKCQKFDEKFTAATSRLYTNVSEKLRRTNVSGQLRRNVANLLRMST